MFYRSLTLLTIATCTFLTSSEAQTVVKSTSRTSLGDGPFQAHVGTVALPADGIWQIRSPKSLASLRELHLMPTAQANVRKQLGSRMYAALEEKQINRGKWTVQRGYEACRKLAQEGDGTGPERFSDFADYTRWKYLAEGWDKPSWRTEMEEFAEEPHTGPFVQLVPNVRFQFAPLTPEQKQQPKEKYVRRVVKKADRVVLAFGVRPFVDDVKHWVLYTDGNCERIEIDPELVKQHGVKVRPMISKQAASKDAAPNMDYRIVLVTEEKINDTKFAKLQLEAYNQVLDQTLQIGWDTSVGADAQNKDLRTVIDNARRFAWRPYLVAGQGGVLNVWQRGAAARDAARGTDQDLLTQNRRRQLSMFSVLGGRAAIEETLQLQNLNVSQSSSAATIDIDSLQGVKVKSHPFEEMLDGQAGGSLEMARVVPADRFFVYIGKPESITAMLDSGAPFIASAGTTLTGNCLKYNLEKRYLQRMGMTREWVDAVLKSGLTSEIAMFTPDLFFIDGTDVTIVAKLKQPALFQKLLGMLGASGLTSSGIVELPTTTGSPAYLALRDDLLFASTNRGEMQRSIDLHDEQGAGSLGDSAEFRYMLTQLPVNDETRIYAYLSDPFVRRLVGPRVKIAQRRRMLAKAKMESLTAYALKARMDGNTKSDSLSDLISSQHLPEDWQADDMAIDATGLVSSDRFGRLSRMRTLPEMQVDKITPEEAEAYKFYMENYGRYWRRFFDPIAVRLDEVGSDELELSTFILPLVDNSIYNGLRSFLAHQDDNAPLSVPLVQPKPVVQFSVNLKDQAWESVAGDFSDFFTRYSGASSAMMDDFGPSVHVAIFDADPIIAVGSGDIFGAFGANTFANGGSSMVMAPVLLSVLTRPCSIMVETQSPERTARYLRQAALARMTDGRRNQFFDVSFFQVGDKDEWIWTMNVFGIVKLRYGVEVVGKYLVIRNIPWSSDDKVVSVEPAEMNAAMLQANPSACEKQLPGLFATAADGNRRAVMAGLSRLYPFMISGSESVEAAAAEHQRLFGFYPDRLGNDQWTWNDFRLSSADYGEPTKQKQPVYDPNRPFGLMNRIDSLKLNMQFEQDGLRSSVRWRLR